MWALHSDSSKGFWKGTLDNYFTSVLFFASIVEISPTESSIQNIEWTNVHRTGARRSRVSHPIFDSRRIHATAAAGTDDGAQATETRLVCEGPNTTMDTTVSVTTVETVGPDTYAIRFDAPTGFSAEPGQFVRLGTEIDGEPVSRFYTLSSPTVDETVEVTVAIDPEDGGDFSQFLGDVDPGTALSLAGPYGDQHYDDESRTVILAGGPGVGPAVAIAERTVADGGEAAIVYRDGTPAHETRLSALRDAGVDVVLLGADEPLDAPVAAAVSGGDDEGVFVYGFADFVEDATAAIERGGGDPDAAKVENFG